jgi:predicted transcriptional regulator
LVQVDEDEMSKLKELKKEKEKLVKKLVDLEKTLTGLKALKKTLDDKLNTMLTKTQETLENNEFYEKEKLQKLSEISYGIVFKFDQINSMDG